MERTDMKESILRFETVTKAHGDRVKIKELYQSAFPLYERMPFWFMIRQAKREGAQLLGIYDGNEPIGMVYLVKWQDIVYIQYFAIEESCRGSGYGSKALSMLKDRYGGCRFLLEMEEVAPDAPNYEQRLKRRAFYEKNGFHGTELLLTELGVRYEFMTVGGFTPDEYMTLTAACRGRILSLFLKPKITERS